MLVRQRRGGKIGVKSTCREAITRVSRATTSRRVVALSFCKEQNENRPPAAGGFFLFLRCNAARRRTRHENKAGRDLTVLLPTSNCVYMAQRASTTCQNVGTGKENHSSPYLCT